MYGTNGRAPPSSRDAHEIVPLSTQSATATSAATDALTSGPVLDMVGP